MLPVFQTERFLVRCEKYWDSSTPSQNPRDRNTRDLDLVPRLGAPRRIIKVKMYRHSCPRCGADCPRKKVAE